MSKAILRTKQLSKQFGKIHVVKNHDGDSDTDCGQPVA